MSIPSISDQPVKFLGKTISFTVSEKDQMEVFPSAVSKGLDLISKSFHRGVQKVWIFQHLLQSQPLKYLQNGLMHIENCFHQLSRKLLNKICRQKLLS